MTLQWFVPEETVSIPTTCGCEDSAKYPTECIFSRRDYDCLLTWTFVHTKEDGSKMGCVCGRERDSRHWMSLVEYSQYYRWIVEQNRE